MGVDELWNVCNVKQGRKLPSETLMVLKVVSPGGNNFFILFTSSENSDRLWKYVIVYFWKLNAYHWNSHSNTPKVMLSLAVWIMQRFYLFQTVKIFLGGLNMLYARTAC